MPEPVEFEVLCDYGEGPEVVDTVDTKGEAVESLTDLQVNDPTHHYTIRPVR